MDTSGNFSGPVVRLARAISVAEGFGPPTAIPSRANNPGDLTGADAGSFHTLGTMNAEGVLRFANLDDGWSALYVKVERMLSGRSRVYPLTLSIRDVGYKYANGDPNWAMNVARELGVSVSTTLAELVATEG